MQFADGQESGRQAEGVVAHHPAVDPDTATVYACRCKRRKTIPLVSAPFFSQIRITNAVLAKLEWALEQ